MKSVEELIEVKRDGGKHTEQELEHIVNAFVSGEMADYQMSAWLMAAFINGLDDDETVWLTKAMAESGRTVDLSSVPGTKVDKHSTGGVGDKTTLVLAPLVASCGVPVAKMSGRGLGHTGGTLDKLESIPGFRVTLDTDAFAKQVRDVGIAVIAQSADVDPADKKMYALRDVTATVPSIPLIVGSIVSKKVAGCADAVLLDVKVGSGAFMKTEAEARRLAAELVRVGERLGRRFVAVLSDMDQPLGCAVGNAVEVREAIATLRGDGPEDLTELCIALGAKMLVLGGRAEDEREGRQLLLDSIASGRALETFRAWIAAQGGDARVAEDDSLLPLAPATREVTAARGGWIAGFDAEGVGRAAMALGAGRARKEDPIDPGAGIVLAVKAGDEVAAGDVIATLYAQDEARLEEGAARLVASVRIADEPVTPPPLFHEV
ncbi:MAG: thymidine phosphorylase [Anaerosomatales bacterium]|nr:thymidine phosphorylase [Anaerosomatales bacterium]